MTQFNKSISSYENAGEHVSEGKRNFTGWSEDEDQKLLEEFYPGCFRADV